MLTYLVTMPPRIPLLSRFGGSLCLRPAVKPSTSLPIISAANASSKVDRRRQDPYALAQARQKKAANLRRQSELQEQRTEALGDPVRGITTPFVRSFDTATPLPVADANTAAGEPGSAQSTPTTILNHFLTPAELETALQHSYILTQPLVAKTRDLQDPKREKEDIQKHAENHDRAATALARIVSLSNGNQKDRTRSNIQRCIETFGRHNTDATLRPRQRGENARLDGIAASEKTPRAGPDTGSSEVQIAILTAKIRVLVDHLAKKGAQKDKINKRNLRLLVHKRQKHLQYLRRKERGGDRWENLTQTLGLTEGTWRGEISL